MVDTHQLLFFQKTPSKHVQERNFDLNAGIVHFAVAKTINRLVDVTSILMDSSYIIFHMYIIFNILLDVIFVDIQIRLEYFMYIIFK